MADTQSLQHRVDDFFQALGANRHGVKVDIVQGNSLVAGSRGVNLWNYPFGQIFIHSSLSNLSKDELDFVLAHEVVHIFYNHLPISVLVSLPQTMIDALATMDTDALWLKLLKDFLQVVPTFFDNLPLEASLTKDQEIQADVFAICTTGNRTAALEALRKLANYDLSKPSHQWEVLDVKLPVMTMGQRLAEIQRITQEYEIRFGYIFR